MIELNIDEYSRVIEPLKALEINTLFAQAVINKQIPGKVYADNAEEHKTFYIVHPYGMSLLLGKSDNKEFNAELVKYLLNSNGERKNVEFLQVYPPDWKPVIEMLAGSSLMGNSELGNGTQDNKDKVIRYTRINFEFDINRYKDFKQHSGVDSFQIVKTSGQMFDNIQGAVIPKLFWKDAKDFEVNSAGYSLISGGDIASTAFAAFLMEGKLEIGIETSGKYRGKGYAALVCSALIDYCLAKGLEPVWSCRLENTASYNLAQKLGFVPTKELPYYQLPV